MAGQVRLRIDSVGFPVTGTFDRAQLASVLCWNQNGEHLGNIWEALCAGKSVEVTSLQVRSRPTFFAIFPLASDEDGSKVPMSSARCVRF